MNRLALRTTAALFSIVALASNAFADCTLDDMVGRWKVYFISEETTDCTVNISISNGMSIVSSEKSNDNACNSLNFFDFVLYSGDLCEYWFSAGSAGSAGNGNFFMTLNQNTNMTIGYGGIVLPTTVSFVRID